MFDIYGSKWAGCEPRSSSSTSTLDSNATSFVPVFAHGPSHAPGLSPPTFKPMPMGEHIERPKFAASTHQSFSSTLGFSLPQETLFILPEKTSVRITAAVSPSKGQKGSSKEVELNSVSTFTANSQSPTRLEALVTQPKPSSTVKLENSSADAFFGDHSAVATVQDRANGEEPGIVCEVSSLESLILSSKFKTTADDICKSSKSDTAMEDASIQNQRNSSGSGPSNGSRVPKEPFVNPYAAYVAALDPDNTIDDGRSYVGGARHYVDRPQDPSASPSPSQVQAPPKTGHISLTQKQPQSAAKRQGPQRQVQSLGKHQQQQQENQNQQQHHQPSPKNSNMQASNRHTDRIRATNESRWSGRSLMTANTLPEGFFGTSKGASTSASQLRDQASVQRVSNTHGSTQSNASRARTPTTFTFKNGSGPREPQLQQQSINRPQIEMSHAASHSGGDSGVTDDTSAPLARLKMASNNTAGQTSDTDEESSRASCSMSSTSEYQPHGSARGPGPGGRTGVQSAPYSNGHNLWQQQQQQSHDEGDPLFLQYPIGDGCYVVVAMYVERDPQSVLRRFPTIQRTRQQSSYKEQSIDQMANILKEALEDEKSNALG
ncbi:hypothetical protein EDD11_002963 [Mortierella claussenii]|nr:hypothetical protein EDD11_002963 [Mortierella claussenii]